MDKLKLAEQNLGQVFNFRYGRAFAPSTSFITAKQPNLWLKTWPKQLSGPLPLASVLPTQSHGRTVLGTRYLPREVVWAEFSTLN